jgi:signal transduction histidine kinase
MPRTTNIARGQPVSASHPLRFPAETLTDGWPGTFSHPLMAGLGSAFYFEIDLGAVHKLDHIVLRNRGDGTAPERLARVTIELYEAPPDSSAGPVWKGRDRADGSHPDVGEVDVIRAGDGVGEFSARWLRVSSDSPVAFSPQLAEVEVYEELGLQLAAVRTDGVTLSTAQPLRVPAGTGWLSVSMKLARGGLMEGLLCRWRLRGYHGDWQSAAGLTAEGACPPPGDYVFEAQVRHSDREWDSEILAVPIEVRAHFWQTRGFRVLLAGLGAMVMAWLVRLLTRLRLARRMAALEANAALDTERARIARDMHDEVGAQLSQLAILQDMVARDHPLPDDVQQSMQQLAQTTRRVVASLDEVVWAVNPKNDTLASLAGYLEQCATGYLGPVEIACRLDAPFEWPAIEVRAQVRHNLVLAFREALQNILKHSGASEVTLKLRLEASHFVIVVADNGCGLQGERSGIGKDGLANMSARLVAVGGTCEVRQRAGGGTEVEMRVRLAHEPSAPHP